jgi:hypothetical protein
MNTRNRLLLAHLNWILDRQVADYLGRYQETLDNTDLTPWDKVGLVEHLATIDNTLLQVRHLMRGETVKLAGESQPKGLAAKCEECDGHGTLPAVEPGVFALCPRCGGAGVP